MPPNVFVIQSRAPSSCSGFSPAILLVRLRGSPDLLSPYLLDVVDEGPICECLFKTEGKKIIVSFEKKKTDSLSEL